MTSKTRQVLAEALRLGLPERAALAAELLASLDGKADNDVELAWTTELRKRVLEMESDDSDFEDWEAVKATLRAKHFGIR